jgi:hypothetical protein
MHFHLPGRHFGDLLHTFSTGNNGNDEFREVVLQVVRQ